MEPIGSFLLGWGEPKSDESPSMEEKQKRHGMCSETKAGGSRVRDPSGLQCDAQATPSGKLFLGKGLPYSRRLQVALEQSSLQEAGRSPSTQQQDTAWGLAGTSGLYGPYSPM